MAFLSETGLAELWKLTQAEDRKVEAQVDAVRAYETIKAFPNVSGKQDVSIDVSDVNFDAYDEILLEWDAVGVSHGAGYIRFDNQSEGYGSSGGEDYFSRFDIYPSTYSVARYRLKFWAQSKTKYPQRYFVQPISFHCANDYNGTTNYQGSTTYYLYGNNFALNTINFSGMSGVPTLSNIVLRGLKR